MRKQSKLPGGPEVQGKTTNPALLAKAEQKMPSIPRRPLCVGSIPMAHSFVFFQLFHTQFVVLNQPSSRTTGPEGSDSTHPQKPSLQLPWAAGAAD